MSKKNKINIFSVRLVSLLEHLNITQAELAEKMETQESTISRWMTQGSKPHTKSIIKISEATGCNPRYLTGEEEIMFLARHLKAAEAARFWNGLKEIIVELGWSEKRLSEETGISEKDIWGFENLKIRPNDEALTRIADATGCRREWLLTWQGNKWDRYPEKRTSKVNVAQPKDKYDKHGGWEPQTDKTDWGYIPKVVKIIDSDTIYSKALMQNIDAFYTAVMAGEDRRKGDRRGKDADFNGEDRRKGERRKKTAPWG